MRLIEAISARKPLIFGHRGASACRPMNTLPAFEYAAEIGADGVELDVHRTADGELVVFHDFTVDGKTDGTGRITSKTLAEVKELDAGGWMSPEYIGTRIPTLDEVFEAVGQRLFINVEIKSVSLATDGIEGLVAETIKRHGLQDRVLVSSFSPLALRRFRRIEKSVPIGYLTAPDMGWMMRILALRIPYEAYHPNEQQITAKRVARMAKRGVVVNTWTVNDSQRARELAAMGVSILISDQPDVIRDALAQ